MAKKISDEICLANTVRLRELFKTVVPDADRFSVVYGAGVDVGMMNYVVVRKTTYSYSSYAIGFDTNAEEIVILPVDRDMENYGTPYYLKKSEISKAKHSKFSGESTIKAKSLPKKYISFTVQEFLNEDPDEVCIAVKQEEEAKKFHDFFRNHYAK